MNDPSNIIVSAIYTALTGSTSLPVYSMVPSGVDNFIEIGDYNGVEDSAKDSYITRATIQIEFVKRYRGQGTKSEVNTDVNTVIGILRDGFSSSITLTGFSNIVLTVDSVNDLIEDDEEFKIYRKFVRFNLIIEQ